MIFSCNYSVSFPRFFSVRKGTISSVVPREEEKPRFLAWPCSHSQSSPFALIPWSSMGTCQNMPNNNKNNNKTTQAILDLLRRDPLPPPLTSLTRLLSPQFPLLSLGLRRLAITHSASARQPPLSLPCLVPSHLIHPHLITPTHQHTPLPPVQCHLGPPQLGWLARLPKLLFSYLPCHQALGALARWPEPGLSRAVELLRGRPPPVAI